MPNPDTQMISMRLPKTLVASLDEIVDSRSPVIRDRTQLVNIILTNYVQAASADKTSMA